MKVILVALALSTLSFLDGQTLWAQKVAVGKTQPKPLDPTVIEWTIEKIDSQPAREFKFEVLEKPEQRKLFRVDAKLLEQKYLARLRLRLPLKAFLDWIPEEQRAKFDELNFVTSEDVDQGYLVLNSDPKVEQVETDFLILARNQEQAQARATTLLALLDLGMARQAQRKLLEKHTQKVEQYRKQKETLLSAEANVAQFPKESSQLYRKHQESLLSVEADRARIGIGDEALKNPGLGGQDNLRLKQLKFDIDVAGVKARLAACEARLGADILPEQRKQLEELKLSAEVELAGCEARRAVTERLMEDNIWWKKRNDQLDKARTVVKTCSDDLYKIRNALVELQYQINKYRPLSLVDGKVIIQPVEWTP